MGLKRGPLNEEAVGDSTVNQAGPRWCAHLRGTLDKDDSPTGCANEQRHRQASGRSGGEEDVWAFVAEDPEGLSDQGDCRGDAPYGRSVTVVMDPVDASEIVLHSGFVVAQQEEAVEALDGG